MKGERGGRAMRAPPYVCVFIAHADKRGDRRATRRCTMVPMAVYLKTHTHTIGRDLYTTYIVQYVCMYVCMYVVTPSGLYRVYTRGLEQAVCMLYSTGDYQS